MVSMASELANMGEHQVAIQIDKKVLRESLMCRRVWSVANILYDILWSEQEQERKIGQCLVKEKMTESLRQCIKISHFCKQTYGEKFFKEKVNQS